MRESAHRPLRQRLCQRAIDGVEDADLQNRPPTRGGRELGIEEAAFAHLELDRSHAAFGLRLQGIAEGLDGEHRIGTRVVDIGIESGGYAIRGARKVELYLALAVEGDVDRHSDWRRAGTIVVEMILKAVGAGRHR